MYLLAGVLFPVNDRHLAFPAPINHIALTFHDVNSYALSFLIGANCLCCSMAMPSFQCFDRLVFTSNSKDWWGPKPIQLAYKSNQGPLTLVCLWVDVKMTSIHNPSSINQTPFFFFFSSSKCANLNLCSFYFNGNQKETLTSLSRVIAGEVPIFFWKQKCIVRCWTK